MAVRSNVAGGIPGASLDAIRQLTYDGSTITAAAPLAMGSNAITTSTTVGGVDLSTAILSDGSVAETKALVIGAKIACRLMEFEKLVAEEVLGDLAQVQVGVFRKKLGRLNAWLRVARAAEHYYETGRWTDGPDVSSREKKIIRSIKGMSDPMAAADEIVRL